jgi:hypothetical protein
MFLIVQAISQHRCCGRRPDKMMWYCTSSYTQYVVEFSHVSAYRYTRRSRYISAEGQQIYRKERTVSSQLAHLGKRYARLVVAASSMGHRSRGATIGICSALFIRRLSTPFFNLAHDGNLQVPSSLHTHGTRIDPIMLHL